MKRLLFLTIIVILYCSQVIGQNKVIRGIVSDISSNEKLIGATVFELTQRRGCITDQYGSFNISSRNDSLLLRFSFVGYETDTILLFIQKDTLLEIKMRKGISIDELVVTSKIKNNLYTHSLRNIELLNLPSLGGEIDILKSFSMFPGIQSGKEGSSDLFVRGGGKGENLILMDNIPLYYVNHLGSFVSVFNPEIINHVAISKYGFPPSYGGRLSSVLDIVLKEGNSEKISGQGSVGLISSKFSINGPVSDKLTFLVSIRRTYADVFTRTFFTLLNENFSLGYNFYDLNSKITYEIDKKNTAHIFSYLGDDNLSFWYKNRKENESSSVKNIWGNAVIGLNLNTFFNSRWQLRNDLYFTRYRKRDEYSYEFNGDNLFDFKRTNISGIRDIGYKSIISYTPIENYTFQFGGDIKYHQFVPSEIVYLDNTYLADLVSSYELETTLNVNNKINYKDLIFLEAGLRATYYGGFEETHRMFFEPRYKSMLKISSSLSAIFSYDKMHQFVHNLNSSGNIINAEIWIPASDQLPASESDQVSGGFLYSFLDNNHQFSINIYRKWYSNLITYKAGEISLAGDKNWENRIATNGNGSAEGIEFLIRRNSGALTGLFAYTFSKSKREFIELNNGNPFVSDFDRPHDITLNLNYIINEKYNINLIWVYKSGLPVTLPIGAHYSLDLNGTISNNPYEAFIYSGKNEYRMRPYHRMDLAFSYKTQKKGKEIRWDFSIYNVYNRFNPYFLFVESDESKKMILKEQSFFPFIPSLSYQITF